jgi:hypothetical protein
MLKNVDNLNTYLKELMKGIRDKFNNVKPVGFWQRLINYPALDPTPQDTLPIFFKDYDYDFKQVFYMGNEWKLLFFNMTIFGFYDRFTESTLVAIVLTYATDSLFKYVRSYFGEQNLSKKCRIDD